MSKLPALNRNTDFRRIYYRGKNAASPLLVTYVMKNRAGFNRVGITSGKKIGNAVKRNRARRLIREAYRQLRPQVAEGFDLVFVARAKTVSAKMSGVEDAMRRQLTSLGLIGSAVK